MKLPENKQERTKIFIMIGLGTGLVLLGIVQGIINPLINSRKNKFARLEECKTGVDRARKEIRAAARSFDRRMETLKSIRNTSEQHILHPVLGNYLLQATDIVEEHADALDIAIEPVREVGISDIPPDSKTEERLLKAYTVRVNMQASYHDALRLMREIEIHNPYACVTSLIVRPRPSEDLENHNVSIEIQWPVWADPEFPGEIEEQLKEEISKQEGDVV
ncbi:MAG: hypothetical protein ISS31_04300 [Kiritimatiellae bacterium]|nr:hypothetical protein [Kiritimatiellia bacterium]